jgi:hypothetical protein
VATAAMILCGVSLHQVGPEERLLHGLDLGGEEILRLHDVSASPRLFRNAARAPASSARRRRRSARHGPRSPAAAGCRRAAPARRHVQSSAR